MSQKDMDAQIGRGALAGGGLGLLAGGLLTNAAMPEDNNERKLKMKTAAFLFGQFVFEKMAGRNGNPTWSQFGGELLQSFNPMNNRPKGTGVGSYIDKWYNPMTKNTDPLSKGETGLMRAGQGAMGVAGLAGGAALAPAAGVGVAAPAAFTPASAAAYGGMLGGLSGGYGSLQRAISGPQNQQAPAPATPTTSGPLVGR